MRLPARLLTLVLTACAAATPALADLYKWTDSEGKVHYSDQPPPTGAKQQSTTATKPRKPSSGAPASDAKPAPAQKTYQEQDAEFKQRQVETAEKQAAQQKAAQEAADKKSNCERAKVQVTQLQSGTRITKYNSDGEITYLSDAEVAAELARAKQTADSWCK